MFRWKVLSTSGFYRDLIALTIAGALALVPCTMVATLLAGHPLTAVACGIAGTLTLFAGLKFVRPELKLLPGATAAVLAGGALGMVFPVHPLLGCALFGSLFGLAQASAYKRWSEKYTLMASSGATAVLGAAVYGQLPALAFLALPQPVVLAGMFGLFGFYMGLGSLPAHLSVRRDLVGERYAELGPDLKPDVKDYLFRTYALYNRFHEPLPDGSALAESHGEAFEAELEKLVARIFVVAAKWQEIEQHLDSCGAGSLDGRMKQVEAQIQGCSDEQALVAYNRTKDALVARAGDVAEIRRTRERLVSSLGYYFTQLEALHVALVRLRARAGEADVDGLLRSVGDLTLEMDAQTKSLDQLAAQALRLPAA